MKPIYFYITYTKESKKKIFDIRNNGKFFVFTWSVLNCFKLF